MCISSFQLSTTCGAPHQASFTTCYHLVEDDMKLGPQVTLDIWHSPNGEDPFHSWLATYQALIGEFLINLQDK